jgi:RNA polymerase sigma factor (sigma-70 family)
VAHPSFKSLTQAVETYYEELRRFVRQRTGSASIADDMVQETWIRANTTSSVLPDNPRAYLYRMAGNLAIDHLRRQKTWERAGFPVDKEQIDYYGAEAEELPNNSHDPVEVAISQQELAALNAAVRELPDKCREVFLLYRGHGLSMREVAALLSISEKTVEKHIAKAMVHCRARLKEVGRNI